MGNYMLNNIIIRQIIDTMQRVPRGVAASSGLQVRQDSGITSCHARLCARQSRPLGCNHRCSSMK